MGTKIPDDIKPELLPEPYNVSCQNTPPTFKVFLTSQHSTGLNSHLQQSP